MRHDFGTRMNNSIPAPRAHFVSRQGSLCRLIIAGTDRPFVFAQVARQQVTLEDDKGQIRNDDRISTAQISDCRREVPKSDREFRSEEVCDSWRLPIELLLNGATFVVVSHNAGERYGCAGFGSVVSVEEVWETHSNSDISTGRFLSSAICSFVSPIARS